MIDPNSLTKRYYTIGEVSELFNESTSLLRYWESMFKELKPKKDKGGIRRHTQKDILLINDIYRLVKQKGYTLEGAKDGLKSQKNLKNLRQELISLKNSLLKLKDDLSS